MNALPAPVVPVISWAAFTRAFRWKQGEHITLVGPTGTGKTTLTKALLPWRRYIMFLATKKRDAVLDEIERDPSLGFQRMVYPGDPDWAPREIIFPPFPADADQMLEAHRETFRRALLTAYRTGGWTVVADEVRYLAKQLGLERELQILWLQGRSLGVSLVVSTQRPRHIPLEAYDQATHVFLWRDSDQGNVRRLAELGGSVDTGTVMATVPSLPPFHFLYVNTRTGEALVSKWEAT